MRAMAKTGTLALTEERLDMCIDLVKAGAPKRTMAKACCVHEDTFFEWLRKGREEVESDSPSIFYRLYHGIQQAEAELEAEMSGVVVAAAKSQAPNTWQAAMTFLERRYPADWGRRETRVHEGEGRGALPQINILVLNDADARSRHRDVLRSVDSANRVSAGIPVRTGVGSELEAGRNDGGDDLDVDTR